MEASKQEDKTSHHSTSKLAVFNSLSNLTDKDSGSGTSKPVRAKHH